MHPLTFAEIKDFDLIRALNHGLIPKHYLSSNHKKSLQAFVQDYMKEEVFAEGLTRNIPAFSRFFDAMAYSHGELTNYMNIARDCGVNSKTVKEYYQILVDTLLGIMVEPFKRRQHRQVISKASKFYLFDVGIANYLAHRNITEPKGEQFGRAFEHFILMELIAYRSYHELDYKIEFWRTKSGLEVDFVLNKGEVAIEVKGKRGISGSDLHGLRAFIEEYSPRRAYLICCEGARRVMDRIIIIPWEEFLDELWGGKIGVKAGK